MGKIYYVMGKSASGKDTIYKEILERRPELKTVVPCTTRPIREGESDGVEYYFYTDDELKKIEESGRLIERRTYHTVMGDWHYFTVDDGQIDPTDKNKYLMIGTLESYEKMAAYYGMDAMVPLYIEVPDRDRLLRSIEREDRQKNPNYKEVCRRFLADEKDFSEENLHRLGIIRRFQNDDLMRCVREILAEI